MNTKAEVTSDCAGRQGEVANIKMLWKRLFYINYSTPYIRFEGDLGTYVKHLEAQKAQLGTKDNNIDWIPEAMELCNAALQKLDEQRIDEGWKLFHEAQRLEVYSNVYFRRATVIQLREEVVKLNKWRMDAIYKIIGYKDDDSKAEKVTAEELEIALLIRDEHYHTLYYTNRLTREQFNWLFFVLVVLIISGLFYIAYSGVTVNTEMNKLTVPNFIGILLFGSLGATTSTIFHFRNSQSTSRIPEILGNKSITMSRIFVGAGFSIFIFIFLNSNIAGALDIFDFKLSSCYEYFTIAFVSGFSERLALNSIQKILGKKE